MPTILDPAAETEYLALVRAFPPVSVVLSGGRKLALTHIKRLAARFELPADVFIAS